MLLQRNYKDLHIFAAMAYLSSNASRLLKSGLLREDMEQWYIKGFEAYEE